MDRILKLALINLFINIAYAAYHVVFGVLMHSWWLFTIGFYFVILAAVRFTVITSRRGEGFILRFTGITLMILTVPLLGTVILSFVQDRGNVFYIITMLAIAVFAFTKLTLATVNLIKSRHSSSPKHIAIRNIAFADAFVSIFSLQRSMLVSFEGMTATEIRIMNAAVGSAVCMLVFILGLRLVRGKASRIK